MTRRDIQRLVDAHDRVWAGWWPALCGLSTADARRRIGGSYPSVFATTAHMVTAEHFWQGRLEHASGSDDTPPARRLASLCEAWGELRERRHRWLVTADPRDRVTFVAASGDTVSVAAWECVVHVVSHAHFHRGQLASQFRALGVAPPSRHLIGPFFGEF